jgi:Family of unknown function (DUF5996)
VSAWPALDYDRWQPTRDTLHSHTQLLGKLAARLAPPEPQLQHAALRLTARGWETAPLPLPDRRGALVVALDLPLREAVVEHSEGARLRIPLTPNRSVAAVTRDVLDAVRPYADVQLDLTPRETAWTTPLDEDEDHATFDSQQVDDYFVVATAAAQSLAQLRAPYRGRVTPVHAWWGSFDLAVNIYSGRPALPPSDDFIMRNAMDSEEVAVGWWPGDARYPHAAFYAYAHPAPDGFDKRALTPAAARWHDELGEYVFDWADAVATGDPIAAGVAFARSAAREACELCGWDSPLAASLRGMPPPVA